jgi:predicted phage terminase large subunit-like protein
MPHQIPILESQARFKTVACGRRWGKTALGLMAVLDGHGAGMGALDGKNIWWVTSNYKIANRVIWPNLKKATAGAWVDKSEQDKTIILPGGGSVTVRSADNPDSLRGDALDGLALDEAAFHAEYLWTDVLRPALSDRQGWAIFISTPNGKNWFHELYRRGDPTGKGGRRPGWESWQRPSSENPMLTAEELEAARHELGPRSFRQEYLAEFMDVGGAEWPGDWFPEDHWFDDWPVADEFTLRVVAVDSSMGKEKDVGDYSAIVFLGRTRDGTLWIDCDMQRRPITQMVADGIAAARQWQRETGGALDGFGVESDLFQALVGDLFARESKAAGIMLPVYQILTGGVEKMVRIRRLTPYLSRGLFRWRNTPGVQMLLRQAREFPVGEYDDGPDATEMALRLAVDISYEK